MSRILMGLVIALAVCVAGAAHAAQLDAAVFNSFKAGVTTKADVRQALGEPAADMPSVNAHTALIYEYDVVPTEENGQASHVTVAVLFDPGGRFVRYRLYKMTPEGAVATEAPSPAPAVQMTIDPLDATAMRGMDWAGLERSPLWTGADEAGPRDQPMALFRYSTARKTTTLFGGNPYKVALQVARDGSGTHRIDLNRMGVEPEECGALRDRLSAAYGAPRAVREARSVSIIASMSLEFRDNQTQWVAGVTTVTQKCSAITLAGKTVHLVHLNLEPTALAPLLAPLITLQCDGLKAEPKARTAASLLIFDPRELLVRAGSGTVLASFVMTEDTFVFSLEDKRAITIDRNSGAYTVKKPGKSRETQGMCRTIETPA